MPKVTLPDGAKIQFENPVTVFNVAEKIGVGLAKAAIAGYINDQLVDLSYIINFDSNIRIITSKDKESLDIIRHSAAHLMAQAVKLIFPTVKIAIGPKIDNGFYYDFDCGQSITVDHFQKIEDKMRELAEADYVVEKLEFSRNCAIDLFEKTGEIYKVELIKDLSENEKITLYKQGDFIDLCKGPHVPRTSFIKNFKLLKVAGAYWRGDSNNKMLQRIYGTAWPKEQELKDYLHHLEEAEKRDHRKIGSALDLFHFQEEAPGMVFWHPKGWATFQEIISYMRRALKNNAYLEVAAPQIISKVLWEKSGHWQKFRDNMFTTSDADNNIFCVKPMNCPGHILIYNQGLKSYRDLPLKYGEFGICHRNECSGTLHGLMRIRQFTQDDAHVFCTEEQIQDEVSKLIDLVYKTYKDFGFSEIIVKLATRPEERIGEDYVWDLAEQALEIALNNKNISWMLSPGEGAFYGPKIELSLKDSLDRVWQLGTIQVDFSMPERLGAQYVAEDGSKKTPVMIHRAILGSIERYVGILLEHYAGALPLWLSPVQVVVMNITDNQADYAKQIADDLRKQGFRVEADIRNEKVGFKIRWHTMQKIPYLFIVGDREKQDGTVSVRKRSGEDIGSMLLKDISEKLRADVDNYK